MHNPDEVLSDSDDEVNLTALELLHYACEQGLYENIQEMLSHGLSVNQVDNNGRTSFSIACEYGWVDIAELIYSTSQGVINYPDHEGVTPLIIAGHASKLAVVEWLLGHKANVNLADNEGMSPLMHACESGDIALVRLLLASGACINQSNLDGETALFFAVHSRDVNIINLLISAGASLSQADHHGATALRATRDRVIRQYLLQEVLTQHQKSLTDVHPQSKYAASGNVTTVSEPNPELPTEMHFHIMRFLRPREIAITKGVCRAWRELNSTPFLWKTKLHIHHPGFIRTSPMNEDSEQQLALADKKQYTGLSPLQRFLRELIKEGDSVRLFEQTLNLQDLVVQDAEGETLISLASRRGLVTWLQTHFYTLVLRDAYESHRLNLRYQDKFERGLLHWAILLKLPTPVFHALFDAGASKHLPDIHERTPLSYAAENGSVFALQKLLSHEADVNYYDTLGLSPLHYAIKEGQSRSVSLLLEYVDDINQVDRAGLSAIQHACESKQGSIVRILLQQGAEVSAVREHPILQVTLREMLREHPSPAARILLAALDENASLENFEKDFPDYAMDMCLKHGYQLCLETPPGPAPLFAR
jgi:ankyrin repeat protein